MKRSKNRISDVFDPRQNILTAARILRMRANQFQGNVALTIAAYHAGPGAVRKYGGIPPYDTTQKYVQWVLRRYYKYQRKGSELTRISAKASLEPELGIRRGGVGGRSLFGFLCHKGLD